MGLVPKVDFTPIKDVYLHYPQDRPTHTHTYIYICRYIHTHTLHIHIHIQNYTDTYIWDYILFKLPSSQPPPPAPTAPGIQCSARRRRAACLARLCGRGDTAFLEEAAVPRRGLGMGQKPIFPNSYLNHCISHLLQYHVIYICVCVILVRSGMAWLLVIWYV